MNALTKTAECRARSRKVYAGRRGPQGCVVWVIDGNGERKPLNPGRALRNHSPTGFEWGVWRKRAGAAGACHSGRTPRDDHAALNLYQAFKWACIAQILGANWSLSGEEIDNYLARLSEQQEATQPLADPFPF